MSDCCRKAVRDERERIVGDVKTHVKKNNQEWMKSFHFKKDGKCECEICMRAYAFNDGVNHALEKIEKLVLGDKAGDEG